MKSAWISTAPLLSTHDGPLMSAGRANAYSRGKPHANPNRLKTRIGSHPGPRPFQPVPADLSGAASCECPALLLLRGLHRRREGARQGAAIASPRALERGYRSDADDFDGGEVGDIGVLGDDRDFVAQRSPRSTCRVGAASARRGVADRRSVRSGIRWRHRSQAAGIRPAPARASQYARPVSASCYGCAAHSRTAPYPWWVSPSNERSFSYSKVRGSNATSCSRPANGYLRNTVTRSVDTSITL